MDISSKMHSGSRPVSVDLSGHRVFCSSSEPNECARHLVCDKPYVAYPKKLEPLGLLLNGRKEEGGVNHE